ncbi:MAG: hypothetical protein M1833_005248 [Piccolia ochrophora]|nr:MAG: hypothetical protein M1833_005248 [Piccolia ochrophora]
MSGRNLGPVPAKIVFLSELPDVPTGDKVRFLGCGTVALQHVTDEPYTPSRVTAQVNLDLVLETVGRTATQIGEWVNVMGYVQKSSDPPSVSKVLKRSKAGEKIVAVQAIMLWSAGAVQLDDYERTLRQRRKVEQRPSTIEGASTNIHTA